MSDGTTGIGKRIRRVRESLDYSQEEFGEKIGVKGPAVSKYEGEETKRGVPMNTLIKISILGNVTLDWLVTGQEGQSALPERPIDDLFAEVIAHPKVMQRLIDHVRDQVREELTEYRGSPDPEEVRLVDAWHGASEEIRRAAMTMLENSAKESRRNDGGGSDCAEEKSA